MAFARRHPLSLLVVLAALAATGAVFAFARPGYRPQYENEMIDFSQRQYTSPAIVTQAFAGHGIRLVVRSRFNGIVTLGTASSRGTADALQVLVGPRTGRGSYGPRLERYDERFDNLLVTYGGGDERLLARVEAAVDELR